MESGKARSRACGILLASVVMCTCGLVLATIIDPGGIRALESSATGSEQRRIVKLIEDKELDKALKEVEALEAKQPQDASVANLKGAVYVARGDFATARRNFERALALEPNSIMAAMNLAQLDLRDKNPDAARQRYKTVLAADPTNADAMIGMAGIAAATRQDAEYVAWLEKAVTANPSLKRPRILLANHYVQKREMQKALAIAKGAQAANPNDPQVLEMLGAVQLAAGERDNASATYTQWVRLAPNDPHAHYRLATAKVSTGDFNSARAELKQALSLKPDLLNAKVLRASIELNAGDPKEALRIAREIQRQHAKSPAGFMLEGDVLMTQKDYSAARKAYEKASGMGKDSVIAIKLHAALSAAGNSKEADAALLAWLASYPNDVAVRSYLALSYMKLGQHKQAIEQYQRVLEVDPDNARALNNLAWLYQQASDPRALALAERANQHMPGDPHMLDTLGWILVEKGETARGLELLRKAATLAPAAPSIQYHLAAALAKSGDNVLARRELEKLLNKKQPFEQRTDAEALLKKLTN